MISEWKFQFFLVLVFLLNCCQGQQLSAKMSKVKLPSPRILSSAVYDGTDWIYIVGGYSQFQRMSLPDVLVYSVSSDNIYNIKENISLYGGNLVMGPSKRIFYCGGIADDNFHNSAQEFKLSDGKWHNVTSLPQRKLYSAAFQPTLDTVYLVGGQYDATGITLFNISDSTATEYDAIPELSSHMDTTAVWDAEEELAIIISSPEVGNTTVVKYSPGGKNYTVVSDSFPHVRFASSVWDGKNVYIIGGAGFGLNNGVIQYDPVTDGMAFIPVEDFPAQEERFYETTAVYVDKLNRIYIFGGRLGSIYSEGIWWIDL